MRKSVRKSGGRGWGILTPKRAVWKGRANPDPQRCCHYDLYDSAFTLFCIMAVLCPACKAPSTPIPPHLLEFLP